MIQLIETDNVTSSIKRRNKRRPLFLIEAESNSNELNPRYAHMLFSDDEIYDEQIKEFITQKYYFARACKSSDTVTMTFKLK